MFDATELEQALAGLSEAEGVEVYDAGKLLPFLSRFRYEVRQQQDKVLLHLWTDEGNLVRRVLRLAEYSEDCLVLEVARFGQRQPGRLEFVRAARVRAPGRISREKFRAHFRRLLQEQFPDEDVGSLTAASDLERSFSGCYVRGLMSRGTCSWAVMGAASAEPKEILDRILSFGLLWLDWNRAHAGKKRVAGLRLFLPKGRAASTAHLLRALGASAHVELFEVDESRWRVTPVDPNDAGNIDTWLTPRREIDEALHAAGEEAQRIRALAPDAIDVVMPPGEGEAALRFHGLEFARWSGGEWAVGLGDRRRRLLKSSPSALDRLVRRLKRVRNSEARDKNGALYRAHPERWLESMILRDPSRVDAHLNPACIYSQVPAFSAGDRGVLDLLGVRKDGRLVVVELKAAEDIHLVLQATDYWLRVLLHHQRGEFKSYGYFRGIELQDQPPLLYLVAPGFRFHSTTDVILRYLSPEIEVSRIGLNENWRSGIQVVFRQ